jgi:hypothetical protein
MKIFIPLLAILVFPVYALAAELTNDSLAGKWIFTHMILDGESERPVNRLMQFEPGGAVLNYDAAGKEKSRAAFVIETGVIVYTDERGAQRWKVVEFSADSLHVNHSGAEMFFRRH